MIIFKEVDLRKMIITTHTSIPFFELKFWLNFPIVIILRAGYDSKVVSEPL